MKNPDEFLNKMLEESEKKAEALDDAGHLRLIQDLKDLLETAEIGRYHDFHKNGEDAPKVALVQIFEALRQNVMEGRYDN